MIAIFTALPEELAPLLARSSAPAPAGRELWRAAIGGTEVFLATTGEGPGAGSGARERLAALRPEALIGVGIAGGLSPGLRRGDVIAAREVRGENGDRHPADAGLLARAAPAVDRVGIIVSGSRLCSTAAEKRALLARHPGAENAAADLESAGWARAAAGAGVAFLAIRAVLDPSGEDLPVAVRRAWSGEGLSRAGVVLGALARPREIPALLDLARGTRRAMESIAGVLPRILKEAA